MTFENKAANKFDIESNLHQALFSPLLRNETLVVSKQILCSQYCHMIRGKNMYLSRSEIKFFSKIPWHPFIFFLLILNLFQNFKQHLEEGI